ncbi:DUF5060 domain-containing protein [Microlunatus parietis]|uniref:DUF5060 domain-containing protein n=1 Tax=Microlunatus parietis TaxID=682979 RepID=A0A7Y9I6Z9_9ACTN|nr:DUF5060 domain-containing protein [Microlunatus parietis]NYE71151.1 hypothetical protein [Microlunatus parietis]
MSKIAKWEVFEATLSTSAEYQNPFLDVDARAVFSGPSEDHRVDGFYDGVEGGRHVWRVRFAPTEEGAWTYRTEAGDPELITTGEFTCTPAISAGAIQVSRTFGNWFQRQDGSYPFIANDGWYPHVANRSRKANVAAATTYQPPPGKRDGELAFEDVDFQQPSESDWLTYLDILAEHKINLIIDIGQLYARQSTITDTSFRWPWKVIDPATNKIDKDRFNLDFYQRHDRQLRYAKEKGIFFALELLYDNSVVRPREWDHHPVNVANGGWLEGNEAGVGWNAMFDLANATHVEHTRRYVRYTWARYGAFWNVIWSLGSENGNLAKINDERLPQAFIDPAIPAAWYSYWADYLNRRDPYGRLKSFGDAGRQELMVTSAYNNFIVTQDPRNYPKDDQRDWYRAMNAFGELMWKFGRPVVIGEMTAGNNGRYDAERRLYWIALTAGYAMGRCDRHYPTVVDGQLGETVKFGLAGVPPIYADIRRQVEFVESRGVRFWRMRPNDRLLDTADDLVYCLAAEDEEYLLYFPCGGTASLATPAGRAEWFNPRTGESHGTFELPAGRQEFSAPDEEDWVLHLLSHNAP